MEERMIGKIAQVIGPVVDVDFEGYLPTVNEAIEVNRDVLSDKEIASLNTNALKNYKALGENPKPLTIGYEILNNNQQEYQVYRGTPEVLFRGTKDECKAYVRDNEYDKGYS